MRCLFLWAHGAACGALILLAPVFTDAADAPLPVERAPAARIGESSVPNAISETAATLKEIRELVERHMLRLPADIDACVRELYEEREEDRDAETRCEDQYARTYTAEEWRKEYEEPGRMVLAPVVTAEKGIVRIPHFLYEDKDMNIEKGIVDLLSRGAHELYFDLRGNPGGWMENALALLYHFAREEDRFVTLRFRTGDDIVYTAALVREKLGLKHESGILRNIPVCVIIDGDSASAAEIFAGAMKDWGYCVAGAARSFGKGIGQLIFRLDNGWRLRMTSFEFFAGNSQTKIHGVGVKPNTPLPEEMRE